MIDRAQTMMDLFKWSWSREGNLIEYGIKTSDDHTEWVGSLTKILRVRSHPEMKKILDNEYLPIVTRETK